MRTAKSDKRTNLLVTVLVLALCIGVGALVLPRLGTETVSESYEAALPDTGLWVTEGDLFTGGDADKPEKTAELHAEVDELLRFVRQNRLEKIFWELSLSEEYKDTLGYLCKKADSSATPVYAVLPALSDETLDSQAETLRELMQTVKDAAAVEGFVLDASGVSAENAEELFSLIRSVASAQDIPLALVYQGRASGEDGQALSATELQTLTADGTVDLLMPVLSGTADAGYLKETECWSGELAEAKVLPLAAPGFDARQVGYQLSYNTTLENRYGFVLGGCRRLAAEPAALQMLLSFADAALTIPSDAVDLSVGQSLSVGYPDNGLSTYYSTIYIMGTSDPEKPLTLDGTTVERETANGCFGVEVRLSLGSNSFTLRQGNESVTVTVKRLSADGDGTISAVTKASRFPAVDAAVLAGDELTFRCVAPSGGYVTATIDGETIIMEQKVATAKKGIAATFEGTYQVPEDLPADELTNLGKVTYALTYNKNSSTYESEGELYAAGANVTPMVLASTENVSILADYTDDSTILDTLHFGARIATTGCVQYNGTIFFKVAEGYIASSRAEFYPEVVPAASTVTGITTESEGRNTTITFACGNFPAVTGDSRGGVLRLFFRDTTLPQELSGIDTGLVSLAKSYATRGGTQLMLTLADPGRLWGYDIQYAENGDVTLTLKEAPVLSDIPGKPLTGITVMVDPGHGNYDCGALGTAGTLGPTESELNLAIGLVLQQRLEQMGATVVMVRTTDSTDAEKIVLDERVSMAVDAKPDFFLSIHHNSTALIKEVSADWMECYYYEGTSKAFADNLRTNMMAATGRDSNETEWGYYYVTRLTLCPAVLFEVGYIPNPVEYESCSDWFTIQKTACAMAEAVLESVPAAAPAESAS